MARSNHSGAGKGGVWAQWNSGKLENCCERHNSERSRRKFYWFPWAISCRDVSFGRRKRAQRAASEAGVEGKRELKGRGSGSSRQRGWWLVNRCSVFMTRQSLTASTLTNCVRKCLCAWKCMYVCACMSVHVCVSVVCVCVCGFLQCLINTPE